MTFRVKELNVQTKPHASSGSGTLLHEIFRNTTYLFEFRVTAPFDEVG